MNFTVFKKSFMFKKFERDTRTVVQLSDVANEPLGFFAILKFIFVS